MSFFKKMFGGKSEAPKAEPVSYEGFTIQPQPIAEGGQFRLAAEISKEIDGEPHLYQLIRADMFTDPKQAEEFAIRKAKQVIDEQGEKLFG